MGCDIHSHAEHKVDGKWQKLGDIFPLDDFDKKYYKKDFGDEPFPIRTYGLFGFLADVRNYSHVPVIHPPKGLPQDSEYLNTQEYPGDDKYTETVYDTAIWGNHSHSWLTLKELLDFDYEQTFWDRRIIVQTGANSFNGAGLATDEETQGEHPTMKDFLGEYFFNTLEVLKQQGEPENVRVVFWFDN